MFLCGAEGNDLTRHLRVALCQLGFSGGSAVKNPPANAGDIRDVGSVPGLWRSPGGEYGNPLQYSCLENPMDRGAWRVTDWRDLACTESGMWGFALTVSCDGPRLEELNFWFWSTKNPYFLTTDSINFNFVDTLIKWTLPYSLLANTCGACCYAAAITSLSQQKRNSQTLFEQLASILTLTSQLHEQVEYGGLLLLSSCPPLAPKYGVQRESELVNTFTIWERGPPQFHGTFPDLTLCLHLTVHLCLF